MAYTTINKSTDYFNTKLYTGNGTTNTPQTGVGFQPDWTWIKGRSVAFDNNVFDAVRGPTKRLITNSTGAETTANEMIKSFNSDGFTLGNDDGVNKNSDTFVAWNWKANGAGSANTAGTINSTVSANTTAGFSIVKFTGNGSSGATVGHGLTTAPKIVLIKTTSGADAWTMLNTNIDLNKYLSLNSNSAEISDPMFNNTAPTTTVFTLDADGQVNGSGVSLIAYCFSEVTGYSKFGKYTGNGNTDGTFVYTGFKPAFYMIKRTDTTGSWIIKGTKRPGYNVNGTYLVADTNIAEATGSGNLATDELSNGFKIRGSSTAINASGGIYSYMAFAEAPLVGSNGVTAKAR